MIQTCVKTIKFDIKINLNESKCILSKIIYFADNNLFLHKYIQVAELLRIIAWIPLTKPMEETKRPLIRTM